MIFGVLLSIAFAKKRLIFDISKDEAWAYPFILGLNNNLNEYKAASSRFYIITHCFPVFVQPVSVFS
jgi:hypothetical protein